MARPLRIEFPGAIYHVTSRGNERRTIVRSDRDRKAFLRFLGLAVKRFNWSLSAWVLMTNHFHLVIQTREANLSRGMHWFNSAYANWYNHAHHRSGHLYQGRFHSFLIEKDTYFAEVLRYVVLNPVRAKMVDRPEAYRWSSYRATAGLEPAPDWLDCDAALALFASSPQRPEISYREFVLNKITNTERIWDRAIHGIFLGGERWARAMRTIVEGKPRSTDHPVRQRSIGRPRMPEILAAVAQVCGETLDAIRSSRSGAPRRLASWIGWHEGLITLRSIAAALRLRSEGHISNSIRRCEREFSANPRLLGWLDASLALLRA